VNTVLETAAAIAGAYLIGSISFGYVAVRVAKGVDVRKFGSGSTGTTNVLRTAGVWAAVFTVAGDFLKGVLVALAAWKLNLPQLGVVLTGLAVVAGHNWPIFLRFKGGRGVATGFGVSLGLTWPVSLSLLAVWALVILVTRYVSLASIFVSAAYPIVIIFLHYEAPGLHYDWPIIMFALIGGGAIIGMHWKNLVRLVKGQESKIGQKVDTKAGDK
jgi:acyl phosphate:glycerol-3-phosphate acyltransferase